ncbi:hypothetical protein NXW71_17405 [Parabacteroides merdae]|nr:hypothetical protein [Parabacteroides merdae]
MEGESIISLFGKVVKGDEAAFRLLFETYSRRLFHVAYYYLNSRELAEEAIRMFLLSFGKSGKRCPM